MRRKAVTQYPPFLERLLSRVILDESGDSGHNPSLDGRAKIAVSSPIYERFLGRGKNIAPELGSMLIIGDSVASRADIHGVSEISGNPRKRIRRVPS
jgi:hypothetical protein